MVACFGGCIRRRVLAWFNILVVARRHERASNQFRDDQTEARMVFNAADPGAVGVGAVSSAAPVFALLNLPAPLLLGPALTRGIIADQGGAAAIK